MPKHTLISIEGNIGSGKSTLLRMMKYKYPNLRFIAEPVQEWQAINGDPDLNLLGQFYEDPQRWAYTMQVYAFYSRLKHWKEELTVKMAADDDNSIILSERSIQADKEIFAVNGHQNGLINKLEFALYEKFYDWLVEEVFGQRIKEQIIIYLRVDPEVCFNRIQKRARDEEKTTIKKEYLEQLHNRHEAWLTDKHNVVILNGNADFEANPGRQDALFAEIEQAVKGLA